MFSKKQQKKGPVYECVDLSCNNVIDTDVDLARSNIIINKNPAIQQEKYSCTFCNYNTCKKSKYNAHIATDKHKSNTNSNTNLAKKRTGFHCDVCNYSTNRRSNYNDHLDTDKHKRNLSEPQKNEFICPNCMTNYTSRSGLWRHQKNCQKIKIEECPDTMSEIEKMIKINDASSMKSSITPELIMLLIQQNKEMQQMMLEQQNNYMNIIEKVIENGGNHNNINNSNNTINNDNKSFNLNFFLNETCKNAMNLSDFVDGVDISLDDFEETGRIGYVEGLSRVFCKELKKLHFTERPIHCSDLKRETIYIRENNRWEKDENKEKLLRAVKQIGKKNINVLTLWQEKYPGYKDVESKENDRYLHILTNIMCGETEEEIQSNYGKIMKNISRITVVDKH